MSSTITTKRGAGALRGANGKVYYALFERTYESNVHPQDPSWGCIGFGDGPDMVRRIFEIASNVCGGMLRGRNGRLTPHGYIGSWLKEMANPHEMDEGRTMRLSLSEGKWTGRDEIHPDVFAKCKPALLEAGHDEVVAALEQGGYTFTLEHDAAALAVITRYTPAWRLFSYHGDWVAKARDLGWSPAKAKHPPQYTLPGVYHYFDDIIEKKDGHLVMGHSQWSVEARFVREYGDLEVRYPGHYRAALRALKQHLDSIPELPETALVEIDPSKAERVFAQTAESIWASMGRQRRALRDLDRDAKRLLHLCGEAARFIVGDQACAA